MHSRLCPLEAGLLPITCLLARSTMRFRPFSSFSKPSHKRYLTFFGCCLAQHGTIARLLTGCCTICSKETTSLMTVVRTDHKLAQGKTKSLPSHLHSNVARAGWRCSSPNSRNFTAISTLLLSGLCSHSTTQDGIRTVLPRVQVGRCKSSTRWV